MLFRIDDYLLPTEPLNDKRPVFDRHSMSVYAIPANDGVDVEVIEGLPDLVAIEAVRLLDRSLQDLPGGEGVRGVIRGKVLF